MITYVPAIESRIKIASYHSPLTVYLKLTAACVLSCNFCSQNTESTASMQIDEVKRILKQLSEDGVIYIVYTGGEPLLHPHIGMILEYGRGLGFNQYLVTSGDLVWRKKYASLIKFIDGMGISLHGRKACHDELVGKCGSYDDVNRTLDAIRSFTSEVSVTINCTLVQKNTVYKEMLHLAKLASHNDCKLSFARMNVIGKGAALSELPDINNVVKLIDRLIYDGYNVTLSNCIAPCTIDDRFRYLSHGCGAGIAAAAIEVNGDVKICSSASLVLGNVKKQKFTDIWQNDILCEFRKMEFLPIQCMTCSEVVKCRGGCHAESAGKFGENVCDAYASRYFENIWSYVKNKRMVPDEIKIRREGNSFVTATFPGRIMSDETLEILRCLDGSITCEELLVESGHLESIKELIISLAIDDLIVEVEE